jgi:membrane-associated phospholipid phosphatase
MARLTVLRRRTALVGFAVSTGMTPLAVGAQHIEPHARAFWISGGLLMGAAAPADEWVRSVATHLQTDRIDRLTRFVEPVGRPVYLVPALVATYAVARGMDKRKFADATLRTTLSYAATDALGHFLKWTVGRHRPSDGGSSTRFRPGSRDPAWHSFPSGHAFQIFAIAAVAADETDRPWVGAAGYALASLTGLERIYKNNHWTSDVVAGAVIAISTGLTVDRWIRRNGLGSLIKPRQPPDP